MIPNNAERLEVGTGIVSQQSTMLISHMDAISSAALC